MLFFQQRGQGSLPRLFLLQHERIAFEDDPIPAGLDEVADVLMVAALRMFEHVVAVIAAETMQGLLRCQLVQSGKREYFAGAVVLPGFVLHFSVAEYAGDKVVICINHRNGVVEGDAVRRSFESLQILFHEQ